MLIESNPTETDADVRPDANVQLLNSTNKDIWCTATELTQQGNW
jgi:hypothetical protein